MSEMQHYNALDDVIDEAGIGVLGTVDPEGRPHLRWMTVATEKSRPGAIFTVSCRESGKVEQLRNNSHVQWMFSEKGKTAVVDGQASIIDNPTVVAGVIELMGGRLERFWKQDIDPDDIVVLETIIGEVHIQ